jgi:hypothetical protein
MSKKPGPIRAYRDTLVAYLRWASRLGETRPIPPAEEERRGELLDALEAAREPALVAGTGLGGETYESMSHRLDDPLEVIVPYWYNDIARFGWRETLSMLNRKLDPFLRALNDLAALWDACQARSPVNEKNTGSKAPQEDSLDAQAVGILARYAGNITKKDIARILVEEGTRKKCNEKSLAPGRCPRLDQAIKAYRSAHSLPHGSKSRNGVLEAEDDG